MTDLERAESSLAAAMATRDLMSATNSLFEMSASKTMQPFVAQERNDIEAAYVHLGRMLSMMKAG